MIVHYKQIVRRFNALRTKKRYKEKRIRRAYLTEAFNDGELDLYKPTHKPYRIYTDKWIEPERIKIDEAIKETQEMIRFTGWWDKLKFRIKARFYLDKPVKFNWFEKFLLWIKKW